ncbi:MAG: amidohydrolase family protein [Thermoleophilia bacterium]|nr:amidohydrolase family protein [Thermoleophilia bacterium]
MLLAADWVVPVSRPPVARGAVHVRDGQIQEIGSLADLQERLPDEAVWNFPGCALIPGFINAHSHLEYSCLLGFSPPTNFGRWMLRLLLARRKLDDEDWRVSALWGAYECLRSGITFVADSSFGGEAVARAARETGLRARIYLELFGLDDRDLAKTMSQFEERLSDLASRYGDNVEWGISPHAPYTVSARLYREAARLARRACLPLATHVAESPAEVDLLMRGKSPISWAYKLARLWTGETWRPPRTTPVQYVAGTGALGPETVVAHAVQLSALDIEILASRGVAVAHCPRSNAWLKCGDAPVAELRKAGVRVGLGTDSLASNENLDMFAEMRAALEASGRRARQQMLARAPTLSHAPTAMPPSPLTCEDVFRLATLGGAEALGLEGTLGSLEPGKQADIVAVRLPDAAGVGVSAALPDFPSAPTWPESPPARPESAPAWPDPVSALVERATAADVVMTMVAGVCRYQKGGQSSEGDTGGVQETGSGSSLHSDRALEQGFPPLEVKSAWQQARAKLGLGRA